jgi:hypothetical protein
LRWHCRRVVGEGLAGCSFTVLANQMSTIGSIPQAEFDKVATDYKKLKTLKKAIEQDLWGQDFSNKSTLQSSSITLEDYALNINRPGPSRPVISLSFLSDKQNDPTQEINHVCQKWADQMLDIHIRTQKSPTIFIPH